MENPEPVSVVYPGNMVCRLRYIWNSSCAITVEQKKGDLCMFKNYVVASGDDCFGSSNKGKRPRKCSPR